MSDQQPLHQHDFDGIEELDNPLPRWWLGIFWVTTLFAVLYVPYYHWLKPEKLPEAAYAAEVAKYTALRAAAEPSVANEAETGASLQARFEAGGWSEAAKADYESFCAACHMADGGGGIGPNFTDDAYIHGGTLSDLIRVITEGVPEKGMVSWKAALRPEQIEQLAFYIRTLRGTQPANPKEAQGKRVDDEGHFVEE